MTHTERVAEQIELLAKAIGGSDTAPDAKTLGPILDDFTAMLRGERCAYSHRELVTEMGICPENESWVVQCDIQECYCNG